MLYILICKVFWIPLIYLDFCHNFTTFVYFNDNINEGTENTKLEKIALK